MKTTPKKTQIISKTKSCICRIFII